MSKETEAQLIKWREVETDTVDDMHCHMKSFGKWEWGAVANEGMRMSNLMLQITGAENYTQFAIIQGVAAQAAHGAFSAVAKALNVSHEALEYTVGSWYENQDKLPPAVSFSEFERQIAAETEEIEAKKKTSLFRARVNTELMESATEVLKDRGLTLEDAFIFFMKDMTKAVKQSKSQSETKDSA